MAYKERGAMVRIHTIANSSTTVVSATLLAVTPLAYAHNTLTQERARLAFTQIMTTRNTSGNDGYFSHVIRTDEYATTISQDLPALGYHPGFERPLSEGILVLTPEMSCSLVGSDGPGDVAIQTLTSAEYNDNVVDNSILVEVS